MTSTAGAKLLLKARPTPIQLADRLQPVEGVWPDGVELYLSATDLATQSRITEIAELIGAANTPEDFAWLIEGPVDSLDGADFDIARESEADQQVVERLAQLAHGIHARAVNIHVISPDADLSRLTLECRAALLARAVPFLKRFVDLVQQAGAIPTVENMPPVLRMRRADFAFTPIGMASADLHYLVERIEGLRVLGDTSHAGLYLNARRLRPDAQTDTQANTQTDTQNNWSEPLSRYLGQLPAEQPDLIGFLQSLPALENAQVSNAHGILGEGLAYDQGDFDLDAAIRWLNGRVHHVVAETIEANHDHAVLMRDALVRMRMALA